MSRKLGDKAHRFSPAQYDDNMATLPELCFAAHQDHDKYAGDFKFFVILKRGETGFYPVDPDRYPRRDDETTDEAVRRFNDKLGVTTAQRMAMELGSLFGFDVPGADPRKHLARAFIEDLGTVAPELAAEAKLMAEAGADYEAIRDRFKALYEAAAESRAAAGMTV